MRSQLKFGSFEATIFEAASKRFILTIALVSVKEHDRIAKISFNKLLPPTITSKDERSRKPMWTETLVFENVSCHGIVISCFDLFFSRFAIS